MNKDALISALAELPCGRPDIGLAEMSQFADNIISNVAFAGLDHLPRAQQVGSERAKKELRKYAELCAKLHAHILEMSHTSLDVIESLESRSEVVHPIWLLGKLERAHDGARRGLQNLPPDLPPVMGASRKISAARATDVAARAYEAITGDKATWSTDQNTRVGPWLEFLGRVFKALNIKARPEAQTKAMKQRRAEEVKAKSPPKDGTKLPRQLP